MSSSGATADADGLPLGGLTAERREIDTDVVLALAGELDLMTASLVADALARIERELPERVVIDLGELTFIDSAGLNLIASTDARYRNTGRAELELYPGPRAVQRLFALTGLEERLRFR